MRRGKEISQGAHASMAVLLNRGHAEGEDNFTFSMTPAMRMWVEGLFAKITVYVNSEEELIKLHEEAKSAGIPTALITDSGRTEFNGVPTKTAVAIGPEFADKIDAITGNLPLY